MIFILYHLIRLYSDLSMFQKSVTAPRDAEETMEYTYRGQLRYKAVVTQFSFTFRQLLRLKMCIVISLVS